MEELQFRRNNISYDGVRALAAVLAKRSSLKLIDLQENHVSIVGMKAIPDALERFARIHKVLVHPGGKIEAFGASETISESESPAFAIKTVCIVDLSKTQPKDKTQKMANVAECRKSLASRCNSEKKKKRNMLPRKSDYVSTANCAKGKAGDATSKRHSASAPNKLNCGDGGASLYMLSSTVKHALATGRIDAATRDYSEYHNPTR